MMRREMEERGSRRGRRRLFRNGLLVAIAAIVATALPAEEIPAAFPEEVGMSSERLLEIDAVVQRHIDSGEIQGAVAAVARRGKVVHFKAYGLMDVERGRAMQEDAIFRMASSSKPVLAVAAMISEVLSGRPPVYPVNRIG